MESCDSDLYNIIYVGKKSLGNMAGYYSPRDSMWDFVYFHGFIVMNSDQNWTREHFINVKIHELGHGLALPHVPKESDKSDLLWPAGFGCKYREKICDLVDYDFETFIEPFPGIPMIRVNQGIIDEQREWAQKQNWLNGGYGRHSM